MLPLLVELHPIAQYEELALAKGVTRPAALRVNSELGAELTGVARTEEERKLVARIVSASLSEKATVKNSVSLLPGGQ